MRSSESVRKYRPIAVKRIFHPRRIKRSHSGSRPGDDFFTHPPRPISQPGPAARRDTTDCRAIFRWIQQGSPGSSGHRSACTDGHSLSEAPSRRKAQRRIDEVTCTRIIPGGQTRGSLGGGKAVSLSWCQTRPTQIGRPLTAPRWRDRRGCLATDLGGGGRNPCLAKCGEAAGVSVPECTAAGGAGSGASAPARPAAPTPLPVDTPSRQDDPENWDRPPGKTTV